MSIVLPAFVLFRGSGTMRRAVKRSRQALMRQLALRLLAPILARHQVRVYLANLHRIGDSLIDVGFYVKARRLGWRGHERPIVISAPQARAPANSCVLGYLSRHISIVQNRFLYPFLFACATHPTIGGTLYGDLPLKDGRLIDQYLFAMAVQKHWEDEGHLPLFDLEEKDREHGWDVLGRFGITRNDWFACVHVREAGFLREPSTSGHRHLNADIDTYLPAIRSLVERGGWVIRMGDSTMRPLPKLERVVDYAHQPEKSARMDVFLAASCQFWLGTNSGLFMLASSFGVPAALTNVAPATFRPWSYRDLFIPKLYYSERERRILTFRETFAPNLYTSHQIDEQGVTPIDNDEEDILALAAEMYGRLTKSLIYGDRDERLQERFNAHYPSTYYPFGVTSRIGSNFLTKHKALLD